MAQSFAAVMAAIHEEQQRADERQHEYERLAAAVYYAAAPAAPVAMPQQPPQVHACPPVPGQSFARGCSCCGIAEIAEIRTDNSAADTILRMNGSLVAFMFFSSTFEAESGIRLARFIEENKLGEVVNIGKRTNKNSGNPLTMWVWKVDFSSTKEWISEEKNRRATLASMVVPS